MVGHDRRRASGPAGHPAPEPRHAARRLRRRCRFGDDTEPNGNSRRGLPGRGRVSAPRTGRRRARRSRASDGSSRPRSSAPSSIGCARTPAPERSRRRHPSPRHGRPAPRPEREPPGARDDVQRNRRPRRRSSGGLDRRRRDPGRGLDAGGSPRRVRTGPRRKAPRPSCRSAGPPRFWRRGSRSIRTERCAMRTNAARRHSRPGQPARGHRTRARPVTSGRCRKMGQDRQDVRRYRRSTIPRAWRRESAGAGGPGSRRTASRRRGARPSGRTGRPRPRAGGC